jgi:hypothetical protein
MHAAPLVQQGWLVLPHALHEPPEQTVALAVHELPEQQGCPEPPHAAHALPLEQMLPPMQLVPVVQHGWVTAPQAAHEELPLQMLPTLQVLPQHG